MGTGVNNTLYVGAGWKYVSQSLGRAAETACGDLGTESIYQNM